MSAACRHNRGLTFIKGEIPIPSLVVGSLLKDSIAKAYGGILVCMVSRNPIIWFCDC